MTDVLWEEGETRQSDKLWSYLLGVVLLIAAVLVPMVNATAQVSMQNPPNDPATIDLMIAGVLALIGGIMVLHAEINQAAKRYRIDEDGITEIFDLIAKRENRIKFDRITNVSMNQGVFDRYFGTGTVKVHTAGVGLRQPEIDIKYVQGFHEAQRIIEEHA